MLNNNKKQETQFFGTKCGNANSIAAGYATETTNYGEIATGILNKSTKGDNPNSPEGVVSDPKATLFSVGCGTKEQRKNALEVKGDGSVIISGKDGSDVNIADLADKLKEPSVDLSEYVKSNEIYQCIKKDYDSSKRGTNSIAIDDSAKASGYTAIALGNTAQATGDYSVVLGAGANMYEDDNTRKSFSKYILGGLDENKQEIFNLEEITYSQYGNKKYLIGLGGYDGTNLTTNEAGKEVLNPNIKSVQEIINGKTDLTPVITSTDATISLQPNKKYEITAEDTLVLTLAEPSDKTHKNEYLFSINTGSSVSTITFPIEIIWDVEPVIAANKHYEINVQYSQGKYWGTVHTWNIPS